VKSMRSDWIHIITKKYLENLRLGYSNSHAISRGLLHSSLSTAAIMVSALAGVRSVRGLSAFASIM
jgi:hypothetical protein